MAKAKTGPGTPDKTSAAIPSAPAASVALAPGADPYAALKANTPYWNSSAGTDTFSSSANALIPFLDKASASQTAQMLGNTYASAFGSYLNNSQSQSNGAAPGTYENLLSPGRASQALNTVTTMANASGQTPSALGPGYSYLSSILNGEQNYGGGAQGSMSRANYQQFTNMANSLATSLKSYAATQATDEAAKGDSATKIKDQQMLPAWEQLANSFAFPSIPGIGTAPASTNKAGTKTTYGIPSTRLFE
jgi:hypothetical protein